ncbi:hypothetical protein BDA96_06G047700 [Sorghum bicolor]|uniref:Uncharacterized protein n=2 Tax=Sorghum bicolor TaxID=4558 RepID=A0A921UBB5_SORBI|nr:hypothetical protein BDA96_06G047700 [Sorghum bicolor]KXG26032.1 hypothetical protein SORBI_3006G043400 [Sorghum bicolor]
MLWRKAASRSEFILYLICFSMCLQFNAHELANRKKLAVNHALSLQFITCISSYYFRWSFFHSLCYSANLQLAYTKNKASFL